MKKLSLFVVLAMCLFLSGCGKKTLLCSYSSTNSYYGSDNILVKYTFKKNGKVDKYVINEKMVYNKQYLEDNNLTVADQYENAKTYCEQSIPESKNITCKVTKQKDGVTVVINYNLSKMTDEEMASLNVAEYVKSTYDDVKTQYKTQGFTCK